MADVDSAVTWTHAAGLIPGERRRSRGATIQALVLLTMLTLVTRFDQFTNPLPHVDDQFYILTGKALLHGELPYVDVWDRKPIGLFLIYAGIAAVDGNTILVYHLAAAVAALATSIIIFALGHRVGGSRASVLAASAYLLLLPTLGGSAGQSPVFYNLPMAGAALLAFDTFVGSRGATRQRALAAMALCGVAIQIKPTTLFEGAFFGALFLAAEWRTNRQVRGVAALALSMIAVAVLPTAAAFGTYAWMGHFDDMWTATVLSNFTKSPLPWSDRLIGIYQLLVFLGVPIVLAVTGIALEARRGLNRLTVFLSGWLLAAAAGYLSVANFFDHYALPLIPPVAIAMTCAMRQPRHGLIWFFVAMFMPVLRLSDAPARALRDTSGFERLVNTTKSQLDGGCLYIFLGPTALYTATDACRVSPYVFPDHLETEAEATALPVSPEREVERIFSRRPAVVITEPRMVYERNNATAGIVERHLSCSYRLHSRHNIGGSPAPEISVWTLRDKQSSSCRAPGARLGIVQPRER